MVKVYYYNRNGALKLTFNEGPYYMLYESGEFKDNSWAYENSYGKYRNFRRDKTSFPFSVVIKSDDPEDFDRFCDVFTDDIVAEKPGYLLINGWRLDCFVIKSDHKFYAHRDNVIAFEAISTVSTWTRLNTRSYDGTIGGSTSDFDYGRDYSYVDAILGREYNYGYSKRDSGSDTIILAGKDNGYEALIYGPATNPVIYFNNYPIKVNVTIDGTERLHIVSNGSEKVIEILDTTNNATSAFIYRDKEHSPFIELGSETTLTYGEVHFDLTTIERRSEPTWT